MTATTTIDLQTLLRLGRELDDVRHDAMVDGDDPEVEQLISDINGFLGWTQAMLALNVEGRVTNE